MYDYTNITNLIKECVEKGILKEMPKMSVRASLELQSKRTGVMTMGESAGKQE